MRIITTEKVPIKMWLEEIEEGAIEQAKNLANLPFIFKHVAIMPDSHIGFGMPIGGVIACKNVVIPAAVGVDIGCGVGFLETNIPVEALRDISTPNGELLNAIISNIRRNVPVGFNKHKEPQNSPIFNSTPVYPIIQDELENAMYSLGTLGGGNHFIELQKNAAGNLCIMLHSGSRNFGLKIANHFDEQAKELNAKYHSTVDAKVGLAFLPVDSKEGQAYIECMNYALLFAQENRAVMMRRIKNIVFNMVQRYTDFKNVEVLSEVNIHHNYAALENHYGHNVWVHRKGATSAQEGQLGLIPGSQGTNSYVVMGKGNSESFKSCSHGAGRKMGRKQAQRELNLDAEKKILDDQGIIHGITSMSDLDEAAGAYKNIDVVMKNQEDLVSIVMKLSPIAVIKG